MVLQYLFVVSAMLASLRVDGQLQRPTYDTEPLDCVRIRSANMQKLIYGTGFLYNGKERFMAIYNHHTVPHNSAFRIEKIKPFKEPLYYIRMINVQEFVYGGSLDTATHASRVPVFSYAHSANTTKENEGVWLFEKAIKNNNWLGSWYIKNAYFNQYLIASTKNSEPPPSASGASFNTLKMDRTYQPELTTEHQFFIEDC